MDLLDLEQFRAKPIEKPGRGNRQRASGHKAGDWFLKGPIPGAWLTQACALSGRTLRVALALWHLAGVKKSKVVKPTRAIWQRFALSPDAARRGLVALERANLVAVDRRPGCGPIVTILEWSMDLNARPA